jgi:hypothetical protein
MSDDMGYNLKLPTVGEMTFPQWQDWLVHYNALLLKRGRRIEKLEAALRLIIEHPVELSQQWQVGCNEMQKVARKALEGKGD